MMPRPRETVAREAYASQMKALVEDQLRRNGVA